MNTLNSQPRIGLKPVNKGPRRPVGNHTGVEKYLRGTNNGPNGVFLYESELKHPHSSEAQITSYKYQLRQTKQRRSQTDRASERHCLHDAARPNIRTTSPPLNRATRKHLVCNAKFTQLKNVGPNPSNIPYHSQLSCPSPSSPTYISSSSSYDSCSGNYVPTSFSSSASLLTSSSPSSAVFCTPVCLSQCNFSSVSVLASSSSAAFSASSVSPSSSVSPFPAVACASSSSSDSPSSTSAVHVPFPSSVTYLTPSSDSLCSTTSSSIDAVSVSSSSFSMKSKTLPRSVQSCPPIKRKCGKCKGPIRCDHIPISCDKCMRPFHKKCTGLHRIDADAAALNKILWRCADCEQCKSDNFSIIVGGTLIETSATDNKHMKKSLKILQWNADGLATKISELELHLKKGKYDVCVVQETKLRKERRTPRIPGYASIRLDRRSNNGGGGLISYIHESLVFERMGGSSVGGTELSTFRIKMGKRKWIVIGNVYCPPSRAHIAPIELKFDNFPTTQNTIIMGDFNAHCEAWDEYQPQDIRGDALLDWVSENDFNIMNNGSFTRSNRSTNTQSPSSVPPSQGKSAPDVTVCGRAWRNKYTWRTVDAIGSSDHLPIAITINDEIVQHSIFKGEPRWKSKGVDWTLFTNEMERSADIEMPTINNVNLMSAEFHHALMKAAKLHVGTMRPGRGTKSWETPEVREAIRLRNNLRKHIATRRADWMEACKMTRQVINDAKTNAWRKVLEDSTNCGDDSKMWKTIKSLNENPDNNSPNEAMAYQGRLVTSNKRKANIFANHYSGISRLNLSKENRSETRSLKERLKLARSNNILAQPFTLSELKSAIQRMKSQGAAGPDKVPPNFLKHLGPKALRKLLDLYNLSLSTSTTPQSWRDAVIIPILKANKPPSELTSFRPISLTSCIAKLMERMLSERLYDLGERRGWFSSVQAGFRKGRGVEDQILRMTQRITDGFRDEEKSLMVLLDFSKAYDTIWRQRLLHTLLDRGVPENYVTWLYSFFENRQARVKFNGELSKSKKMKQGLPQGSVLAPILFLFYINELATILPNDITVAMYADDVSLLSTAKTTTTAETLAQRAVDIVVNWSKNWKLNLNGSKSETSIFSLAPQDAHWHPEIRIDSNIVRLQPHVRFLGVTLDRKLNFSKHVELISTRATKKMNILRAVAHSSWGWRKEDLKRVYISHIRSILDYAGSSWQPFMAKIKIDEPFKAKNKIDALEKVQNKCLRIITTQAKSTPVEALRAETGVPSIRSIVIANCMKSREKALRLPENHPRRIAYEGTATVRLKKPCARTQATHLSKSLLSSVEYERIPLKFFTVRPWNRGLSSTNVVFSNLPGISGKGDSIDTILKSALRRISEIGARFNIYSDGSAREGTKNGGAGVVITTGDPSRPTIVETIKILGAPLTCSFEEERRAIQRAVEWIEEHLSNSDSAAIFTDSQSICTALLGTSPALDDLRSKINNLRAHIIIQWIPGHSNIPGNELADLAAKSASTIQGENPGISYASICALIKEKSKDPPISHPIIKAVYSGISHKTECCVTSREDQSLLAKLRSGHFMGLRSYRHRVDGTTDPTCDLCQESPQTLEHWLQHCPATAAQRWALFGEDSGRLDCLTKHPKEALALARSTLLGAKSTSCKKDRGRNFH